MLRFHRQLITGDGTPLGCCEVTITERGDAPCYPTPGQRSDGPAPAPVTTLRQVHGAHVLRVTEAGGGDGTEADAAVTDVAGAALVIRTADCVPVALYGDGGCAAVGVAHAGWRGLLAGVVERAVEQVRNLGAVRVAAIVGPHISATAYEFAEPELSQLAEKFGAATVSHTSWGTPAADLRFCCAEALRRAGAAVDYVEPSCTAKQSDRWYSHRARQEDGRMWTSVVLRAAEGQ